MSCLLSSTDVPLMITQVMPAYHRVRGHILVAQQRHHQQQKPFTSTVSDDIDDTRWGLHDTRTDTRTDARTVPVRTTQMDTKVLYTPPAVELSVHLSIRSFDLALTTAEQLLARATLSDLNMDLSPAAPEVRITVQGLGH